LKKGKTKEGWVAGQGGFGEKQWVRKKKMRRRKIRGYIYRHTPRKKREEGAMSLGCAVKRWVE
jgi:hypothetical protein